MLGAKKVSAQTGATIAADGKTGTQAESTPKTEAPPDPPAKIPPKKGKGVPPGRQGAPDAKAKAKKEEAKAAGQEATKRKEGEQAFLESVVAVTDKISKRDPAVVPCSTALESSKLSSINAEGLCQSQEQGIAFAIIAANTGQYCWNALAMAKARPEPFVTAVKKYYEIALASSALNVCAQPEAPGRCKRGFCWVDYSWGLEIQPLADLGFAIALNDSDFGFKTDTSAALQAQIGIKARLFLLDDRVDVHALFGATNARRKLDSVTGTTEEALGLATGVGVGFWEGIIGVNTLLVFDPTTWDNGWGLSFFVDPISIQASRK